MQHGYTKDVDVSSPVQESCLVGGRLLHVSMPMGYIKLHDSLDIYDKQKEIRPGMYDALPPPPGKSLALGGL